MQDTFIHRVKTKELNQDLGKYVYDSFNDQRSGFEKFQDSIVSAFRDLKAALSSVPSRIATARGQKPYSAYCQPDETQQWNQNSSGLHVFVHGFQGHPSIWNTYLKALNKKATADVRAPFVPNKGNCSLEEATHPIQSMVRSYIQGQINDTERKTHKISLNLYGVSNGTRITLKTLQDLITPDQQKRLKEKGLKVAIKEHNIAGVLYGTSHWKIRFANWSRVTNWIARNLFKVSPNILEDFKYEGTSAQQLIQETRTLKNSDEVTYKYRFYTSLTDGMVIPSFSALPVLGKNEHYNFVNREGHTSIVEKVFSKIMKKHLGE